MKKTVAIILVFAMAVSSITIGTATAKAAVDLNTKMAISCEYNVGLKKRTNYFSQQHQDTINEKLLKMVGVTDKNWYLKEVPNFASAFQNCKGVPKGMQGIAANKNNVYFFLNDNKEEAKNQIYKYNINKKILEPLTIAKSAQNTINSLAFLKHGNDMEVSTENGSPVLYVVAGKEECDWVYRVVLDDKGTQTQVVKKTKYTVVKAKTKSKKNKEKISPDGIALIGVKKDKKGNIIQRNFVIRDGKHIYIGRQKNKSTKIVVYAGCILSMGGIPSIYGGMDYYNNKLYITATEKKNKMIAYVQVFDIKKYLNTEKTSFAKTQVKWKKLYYITGEREKTTMFELEGCAVVNGKIFINSNEKILNKKNEVRNADRVGILTKK